MLTYLVVEYYTTTSGSYLWVMKILF